MPGVEIGEEDVANFYDLLTALIERTPWRTEEEKVKYQELILKLREINVFGWMAMTTTVENPSASYKGVGFRGQRALPPPRWPR